MSPGEFFSLSAAIVWATAVILFKKSGETVPPFALNLFRVAFSTVLCLLTLFLVSGTSWHSAPLKDYLILFASGIIAIGISDTLFHMNLNIVGAGINAIVGGDRVLVASQAGLNFFLGNNPEANGWSATATSLSMYQ